MRTLVVVLAALANLATVARAQSVTITETPDSAVLGAGDSASTLVVFRNAGNVPARVTHLTLGASDEVRGHFDGPAAFTVPASSATSLVMHIGRIGAGVRVVPVTIWAETEPGGTIVSTFRVTLGAYASADQVADLQFVGGDGVVTSNDRVPLYALIHNKTDSAITVGPLATVPIKGLVAAVDGDTLATFAVPAHGATFVPMYMTGASQTTPGKRTLTVDLPVRWTIGHSAATGAIVATKDVDVDVWGESDLLKALGIPTFLVLPGFLILVTFGLLWKLHRPWRKAGDLPFSGLSPEFWLFGITLSGVFAVVAPLIHADQYLHDYNITDLARVWLASIGLAVFVYAWFAGIGRVVDNNDTEHRQAITPLPGDDIFVLLGRLAADDRPIPTIQRTVADGAARVFELRPDPSDPSKTWVAPQSITTWDAAAAPTPEQAADEARFSSVRSQSSAAVLEAYLNKYRDNGRITETHWATAGGITGPTLVDTKDLKGRFVAYFVDKV